LAVVDATTLSAVRIMVSITWSRAASFAIGFVHAAWQGDRSDVKAVLSIVVAAIDALIVVRTLMTYRAR